MSARTRRAIVVVTLLALLTATVVASVAGGLGG